MSSFASTSSSICANSLIHLSLCSMLSSVSACTCCSCVDDDGPGVPVPTLSHSPQETNRSDRTLVERLETCWSRRREENRLSRHSPVKILLAKKKMTEAQSFAHPGWWTDFLAFRSSIANHHVFFACVALCCPFVP